MFLIYPNFIINFSKRNKCEHLCNYLSAYEFIIRHVRSIGARRTLPATISQQVMRLRPIVSVPYVANHGLS